MGGSIKRTFFASHLLCKPCSRGSSGPWLKASLIKTFTGGELSWGAEAKDPLPQTIPAPVPFPALNSPPFLPS